MPRPTITPPNLSSPKAAVNHLNTENTSPVEYLVLVFSANFSGNFLTTKRIKQDI